MADSKPLRILKAFVRSEVRKALRSGVIVRPSVCSECDKKPRGRAIQSHHDDYTRPLEVRWLCFLCHIRWHKQNGDGPFLPENRVQPVWRKREPTRRQLSLAQMDALDRALHMTRRATVTCPAAT